MTILKTSGYNIAYANTDTWLGDIAAVTQQAAETIDAALARVGTVPPPGGGYGVRNVRAAPYSAVGNGTTDDRAAIQAALDDAAAGGGGIVVIPSGTYGIVDALRLGANTTVLAYGATVRQIGSSGGLLYGFAAGDTTTTAYNGRGNLAVLGGTWDANASDGTTGTIGGTGFDAFYFAHSSGVTVRDVTILNVAAGHAIDLTGCRRVLIDGCRFLGYRDTTSDASRGFSEAVQIDLAGATSNIGASDNTPCSDVLITGCTVGPSTRLGTFGRFVGSHGTDLPKVVVSHTSIRVVGNRIESTLREAIRAEAWVRCLIADNVLTSVATAGAYTAIAVTTVDPTVTGNANIPLTSVLVTRNVIDGCGGGGISVAYATDAQVVGNIVRNVSGIGIYLGGCSGGLVDGNTVDVASSYGVNLGAVFGASTTNAKVAANQLRACTTAGIRLSTGATGTTITGNQIRKATGTTAGGVNVDATATGAVIVGNDLSGNAWTAAAAVTIGTGAASKTDYAGGTAVPGHNLI